MRSSTQHSWEGKKRTYSALICCTQVKLRWEKRKSEEKVFLSSFHCYGIHLNILLLIETIFTATKKNFFNISSRKVESFSLSFVIYIRFFSFLFFEERRKSFVTVIQSLLPQWLKVLLHKHFFCHFFDGSEKWYYSLGRIKGEHILLFWIAGNVFCLSSKFYFNFCHWTL